MDPDSISSPVEQRVLAAVYTVSGCALMILFVWQQLDPDGPREWFARARERASSWRRSRVELLEQLAEIRELPETEEAACEDS